MDLNYNEANDQQGPLHCSNLVRRTSNRKSSAKAILQTHKSKDYNDAIISHIDNCKHTGQPIVQMQRILSNQGEGREGSAPDS